MFKYALTGWEGSAWDPRVYKSALGRGPNIPEGKYLLADLGTYPGRAYLFHTVMCDIILLNGARRTYGKRFSPFFFKKQQVKCRPVNKNEPFNLWQASVRNVFGRAFSVLKNRFGILLLGHPYVFDIQKCTPAALCAIHNFIRIHKSDTIIDDNDDGMDRL